MHAERHGRPSNGRRAITYCVVPAALAPKLHDQLRRRFRDDPAMEVVVESRATERRMSRDRRGRSAPVAVERRRIRATDGRRVAERRAPAVDVPPPAGLPRRALANLGRLQFVERLEPSGRQLEDIDTARLVTRFQGGDPDVFSALYMRYFDRVYGYLRIALKDPHEAEDAAQQTFMKVLEALPRYERRRQPFRAWLFVIVRNQALEHLRKTRAVELVEDAALDRRRQTEGEQPDLRALDWISDRDLVMFVERLPAGQKQVLMLRYMLDLDFAQIAEILDRTQSDVRMQHHRAVRFLEHRLTAIGRRPESREGRVPVSRGEKQYGVLRLRRFALVP